MSNLPAKKESFFSQPDKVLGLILPIVVGSVIFYFFGSTILPFLKQTISDLYWVCTYGGILAFLAYHIFTPKTKLKELFGSMYQSFNRWLLSAWVNFDPIGIMKNYIENLKTKRVEMNDNLTKLNGSISQIKNTIDENSEKISKNLKTAKSAQDALPTLTNVKDQMRYKGEITVNTQEAGLLRQSNEKLIPLLNTMTRLYDNIDKLYVNSEYLIRQMVNEVNAKEKMYLAYKQGSAAVRAASAIYGADGADKEMFDMSVEALKVDMGNRIGEIDRFMEQSMSMITNIDIQKGVNETEGLKMLEEFENEQFNIIFNPNLGQVSSPEKIAVPVNPTQAITQNSKFSHLLKK